MKIKITIKHLCYIGFIIMIGLCFAGCGEEIQPGNTTTKTTKTVKARINEVKATITPIEYLATGTVRPKTTATISAKVMGEIKQLTVNEGDIVKKGDLLANIDDRQIHAKYRQALAGLREAEQGEKMAQSALQAAEASSKLADITYGRYKSLLDDNSISRQEFDEVETRYHQSKAALSQAKFMTDSARERTNQAKEMVSAGKAVFSDTSLTAPFNGTITARFVDPGDMAAPGTPLLSIEETGAMKVHLLVPETHIQNIHINDIVTVVFPSQKTETIKGKIITIDPSADPLTRSFQVKVVLPENTRVKSGMFARVKIPIGETGRILVPATAIVRHGQLTAVFIVDKDNIARFRLVRIGRTFGDDMEILSGLKLKDRYVADPGLKVVDGTIVEDA